MATTSDAWLESLPSLSDDPTHPAQVALRTYALALSLSLGPSLVPFLLAVFNPRARAKVSLGALKRVLRREVGHDGFAFAVTLSVAGGAAIRNYLWAILAASQPPTATPPDPKSSRTARARAALQRTLAALRRALLALAPAQRTFLANAISASAGIALIQAGRQRTARVRKSPARDLTSPTLDLTLLLVVRAIDSIVQAFILQKPVPARTRAASLRLPGDTGADPAMVRARLEAERVKRENTVRQMWTSQVDAFVFWACSARIMWCFFYEPQRLPRSYVRWINTLANLDGGISDVLRFLRERSWSYIKGSPQHATVLQDTARKFGLPPAWGDPLQVPAYGGAGAAAAWKKLGYSNRPAVGGIPCELLHGEVGKSLGLQGSCTANAGLRTFRGFTESLAIYLPVHFLPVLLTRPQTLLRPHRLLATLLGALRSAAFLSSFIGIYWYAVCIVRTLVLARALPFVSHDFWDGPFGCVMAGCLLCGSSIWVENGRRRGEMALYVLPRAVRAILPDRLVKTGHPGIRLAERIAFVLSFSALLTAATHRPDSLRGLSRWTLAFVTNGPNAGFWKRRRRDPSVPPTPSIPSTPFPPEEQYSQSPRATR